MLTTLAMAAMLCSDPATLAGFEVSTVPPYAVGDVDRKLVITAVDEAGEQVPMCGTAKLDGVSVREGLAYKPVLETAFESGVATIEDARIAGPITITSATRSSTWKPDQRRIPGWLSVLPPVLAILFAIAFRQAVLALFAGIWLGALFVHDYRPLTALLRTFDTYLPATIADSGHAAIILFTLALGGMVGLLARSGATAALVEMVSKKARTRRSGMLASWGSGLLVFFDDYANCMLVGNTMRPLTDRLKISREKLSYIVDSTAAPVATIALVSTWIGYQLGIIEEVVDGSPYDIFLSLLPYSFYSFFTIVFVFAVCVTGRDFGPMLTAERRAAKGKLLRDGAKPLMDRELTDMTPDSTGRARDALVPVAAVLVIVMVGIYLSGRGAIADKGAEALAKASFRDVIGAADSYAVLLWASFGGSLVALGMVLAGRRLTMSDSVDAWLGGVKAMAMAVVILVLAWGIGSMCKDHLLTGQWVLSQVSPDPRWLPLITFLLCAFIAFATGSSFSTMAIVIPIAAPMAWVLTGAGTEFDASAADSVRYATLAAVLSGAVFGDHCSPISDTTIMSSMASASDHLDHVRTQAPYALVCAGAAGVIGFGPAGFGVSPYVSLPIGCALLVGLLMWRGKKV